MNASDVIEAYVTDVARRLPRKQRNDVAFELRALLNEELAGRAEAAGRAPDEALAYVLVREFGAPDEVADRYRPESFTIIKPKDTRAFIAWALGGIALQWAVTLPDVISNPDGELLQRFGRWWLAAGLVALWWPGFLVVVATIASFIQYRWPTKQAEWRARVVDRDHINRPLMAIGIAAAMAGAAFMMFLPQWLALIGLPKVVQDVLAYDPVFIATRGPLVVAMWLAQLTLMAVALAEGRWRRATRRIDMTIAVVFTALLVWLINDGPVWQRAMTDKTAKGFVGLVVVFILIDLAIKARREFLQLRPPAMPAASA